MKKKACVPAMVLALLLAIVLLFSIGFIVLEADHDCSGENCAVCFVLHICENALQRLIVFGAAAACVLFARTCRLFVRGRYASRFHSCTPITLRVKLSD